MSFLSPSSSCEQVVACLGRTAQVSTEQGGNIIPMLSAAHFPFFTKVTSFLVSL